MFNKKAIEKLTDRMNIMDEKIKLLECEHILTEWDPEGVWYVTLANGSEIDFTNCIPSDRFIERCTDCGKHLRTLSRREYYVEQIKIKANELKQLKDAQLGRG